MRSLLMVVTHKNFKQIDDEIYKTIIVGNKEVNINNAWRDNVGEKNIAVKNPYYCELTALFWVWKNKVTEYDYIGLCHYRRYFTKNRFSKKRKWFLNNNDISKMMQKYDIILPEKFCWKSTVDKVYYEMGEGRQKDLELTEVAIEALYPQYLSTFRDILQEKNASYCNMFVMSSANMSNYCQWLFSILNYVEANIDMTGYSVQESRVFGYLSEILLNVWVRYNNLKIKYYPMAYTERTKKEAVYIFIKSLFDKVKK